MGARHDYNSRLLSVERSNYEIGCGFAQEAVAFQGLCGVVWNRGETPGCRRLIFVPRTWAPSSIFGPNLIIFAGRAVHFPLLSSPGFPYDRAAMSKIEVDRKFDLRQEQDLITLSHLLPTIDGCLIEVPPPVFVEALSFLSDCLGRPDWFKYQWGMVGPFHDGSTQHPFGLLRMVRLALDLRELSRRDNFAGLLMGFRNPTQFLDTMFEARTASFFSRLMTTRSPHSRPYVLCGATKNLPILKLIPKLE